MTTKRRSANGAAASVAQPKVEGTTVFKLWRDNKIANEYMMTAQEIADRFFASDLFKEWEKEVWTWLDRVWRIFVGKKDGLDSVMEDEDYVKMGSFISDQYRTRRKSA